ncbi:MAG: hypothetical protein K2H86_00715 [Muribaculaceae bacterium]|nr:hypothetical protein [Muribaculaceae bacterium]
MIKSIIRPLMSSFLIILSGTFTVSSAQDYNTIASDPLLESGRNAFMNYDFDTARECYGKLAARLRKSRKASDPESEELQQVLESEQRRLETAERQLERVQDIVIIDSISVRAADFYKYIRIPSSAGYLLAPSEIPFAGGRDAASMAFTPESQSLMLWTEPDSLGAYRIMESLRLADGKYADPVMASDILNNGGDVDFPVLCADGLTLYFSSDGDGSMGGYDIFETVRDARTGEYMPPSNVGMPFNSPYDDFLLVTDEENGVGWWATDRNNLGDQITLYVYMLPDMRRDFEGDEDERIARARISDYKSTWVSRGDNDDINDPENDSDDSREGNGNVIKLDYAKLASEIRQIHPGQRPKEDEFYLPVQGGKVYTRYEQLSNAEARDAVRKYMDALSSYEKENAALHEDRLRYDKSRDNSLGLRIQQQEQKLATAREKVQKLLVSVYRILR